MALAIFSLSLPFCGLALPAFADNNSSAALETAPLRDKWALVIGISKFKDPQLNLNYPAKDAKDFAAYLVKEGNFSPDHVRLLTDGQATRERILDELGDKWLPRVAAPGDLVVIYLSTHGSPSDLDVGGVNYLVAHDTDKDRLYSTGIAMQDLCNIVKARVHSDRALIILDACHSGATTAGGKGLFRPANVDAESVAQGTGQMVICSSSPNQLSWESKTAQNSVFTKRLIEGLKVKGRDTTMDDTFDFVRKKVEEDVLRERGQLQSPVLKSRWQGSDLKVNALPVDPRPGIPEMEQPTVPVKLAVAPTAIQAPPAQSAATTQATAGRRLPTTQSTAPQSRPLSAQSLSPAPGAASLPSNPGVSFARQAEKALRDHFVRMAYATPKEAYADFTPAIQKVTPFERYQINMRKQKYVASVSAMPDDAFKHVYADGNRAVILVNEKWITGLPILWRYCLARRNGVWLIDGFRIITEKDWASAK